MRTKVVTALLLATAALPLGACQNGGGLFGPGYASERVYNPGALADSDVIYRDAQGRYYCRREDGTTGTLVGAGVGAILGNIIAPGGSKTVGTILGGAGGALAGRAIDRADLACK